MVLSQELDFLLKHIAGVKHIIEAGRLCLLYERSAQRASTSLRTYCPALFQDFKIPMISMNLLQRSIHFAGTAGRSHYYYWHVNRLAVLTTTCKSSSLCPLRQKIFAIKLATLIMLNSPDGGYILV
jgi:hypothetical protein